MQAITTRYFGPGNRIGSRIKAQAAAGYIWFGYEPGISPSQNHAQAARTFALKFGWKGRYVTGQLHNGDWVHTNTDGFVEGFEITDEDLAARKG